MPITADLILIGFVIAFYAMLLLMLFVGVWHTRRRHRGRDSRAATHIHLTLTALE